MKHINDAIIVYKAQNGSYPVGNDTFQPASSALSLLAPNYLDSANILTAETGYFYIYRADPSGLNYKLLRGKGAAYHGPVALDSIEVENNDLLNVPSPLGNYGNKTWGYWSPGAVNWAS